MFISVVRSWPLRKRISPLQRCSLYQTNLQDTAVNFQAFSLTMDPQRVEGHNKRRAPDEIPNAVERSVSRRFSQVTEVPVTNQSLDVPVAPAVFQVQPSVAPISPMAIPIPIPAVYMQPFAPYPYYAFSPYANIAPVSQVPPSPSILYPWGNIFPARLEAHSRQGDTGVPIPAVYMPPFAPYPFGVPYQFQALASEDNPGNIHQSEITSSTSSNSTAHHDNWGAPTLQESLELTADTGLSQYSGASVEPALEAESCCVCQDEFMQGEQVGILECGHYFHTGCMMEKDKCPVCKSIALPEAHHA